MKGKRIPLTIEKNTVWIIYRKDDDVIYDKCRKIQDNFSFEFERFIVYMIRSMNKNGINIDCECSPEGIKIFKKYETTQP